MKKAIFLLLAASLLTGRALLAQTGKVYDDLALTSKILHAERKYAVYLPPDYESSGRSYPVLYLLHGGGDDQTGWIQFGEVLDITDKAIKNGLATPMIIIMPDAMTGRRGFFNDAKGDWNYEDFFFRELVPYVEKRYRIKSEKRFRAVAGLSMGGGGAFVYALHHPELFSSSCPLSADIGPVSIEDTRKRLSRDSPGLPDSSITNYYNRYSVLQLINQMPDTMKKAVHWYIDDGDDDELQLAEGNCLAHIAMRKKEILHEFRIRDGGHNWTYWRSALPSVLEFVSQSFHQY